MRIVVLILVLFSAACAPDKHEEPPKPVERASAELQPGECEQTSVAENGDVSFTCRPATP